MAFQHKQGLSPSFFETSLKKKSHHVSRLYSMKSPFSLIFLIKNKTIILISFPSNQIIFQEPGPNVLPNIYNPHDLHKIQVICFINKRLVQRFFKAKSISVKVTVIRIQIVFQHSLNKSSSGLDLSFYERHKKRST